MTNDWQNPLTSSKCVIKNNYTPNCKFKFYEHHKSGFYDE